MTSFRRLLGLFVAMTLGSLGLVAGSVAPAGAELCGLQVSVSTTLTGDVSSCPATPITVTGDNVVLDLGGHTVSCLPEVHGEGPAIYIPSHNHVTIRNGTVRYCDAGIYLEGGGSNTLTALTVSDNIGPLNGNSIFGEGIQLYHSHDNTITNNHVLHNGTFAGIDLYDSSRNTVTGNSVLNNDVIQTNSEHGPTIMQDIGIWLIWIGDYPDPGVTGNVVANNTVNGTGLDGIQLSTNTTTNTVRGNSVTANGFGQVQGIRNGDGIAVFGQNSVVSTNQVTGNGGNGIYVRNNRHSEQILNNRASGNNKVAGPSAQYDLQDGNAECTTNTWRGNTGSRNQACIL